MTVKDYVQKRVAFAIVNGQLLFQKENDKKSSREWLLNDLDVSEAEYETIIRGGLFEDRITIAVGSNYDSVNLDYMSAWDMLTIIAKYDEIYGKSADVLYNGQIPGEVGEDWKPRQAITL